MHVLSEAPACSEIAAIYVRRYRMAQGERFGRHRHPPGQLSWSPSGVLAADVGDDCWVLPPTLGLFIPGEEVHDVSCVRPAELHNLYFPPGRPPEWLEPTVVAISPLLRELVGHLAVLDVADRERSRVESVVFDLLRPLPVAPISLVMPTDPRAHDVARGLLDEPSDDRTLQEWGRAVGASDRTLARRFLAETGLTFAEWRSQARLRTALLLLAAGTPIGAVAYRVGYRTGSAFVAAFRRRVGQTPGAYYASVLDSSRTRRDTAS